MTNVPQDDPGLILYLRNIHMKKYPMSFMHNHNVPEEVMNFTNSHEMVPDMASYISNLVGGKKNGVFFQSLAGPTAQMMTAPWLVDTLNWGGYLVEAGKRILTLKIVDFSILKYYFFRSSQVLLAAQEKRLQEGYSGYPRLFVTVPIP
jgi:hypothetical protein